MESYDTLTDALEAVRKRGFTLDYNLKKNCLKCQQNAIELHQPISILWTCTGLRG